MQKVRLRIIAFVRLATVHFRYDDAADTQNSDIRSLAVAAAVRVWLCVLMGLIAATCVPVQGADAGSATSFAQRQAMAFQSVDAYLRTRANARYLPNRFWIAEVLFKQGKIREACQQADKALDALTPGNKINRWMYGGNTGFLAWPGIDCYIRFKRFMPVALRLRFRKIYTGAVFYRRLVTSNHLIMAATERYLATEQWGPAAFHPDPWFKRTTWSGNYFSRQDPTGKKYLCQRIAEIAHTGSEEWASRPYGSQDILPLLTVAECSTNPRMRRAARMAFETALIQYAPCYLNGILGTFAPRSYPDVMTQTPWGVDGVLWAYFGGSKRITPDGLCSQWALRAFTGGYRFPHWMLPMARDRRQPYVYESVFDNWALYSYVNRSYIIFSRSGKWPGRRFYGQSYPDGVMWETANYRSNDFLWVTNPAADNNHDPHNNPSGLHTHGVTLNENELQHRGTTLYVFNIPPRYRNPYILGYIPGGYLACINQSQSDGRIFINYGSVLIALSASHTFSWKPSDRILSPASKPMPGDSQFILHRLQAAVALETAYPGDFRAATPLAVLEKYRRAVLDHATPSVRRHGGWLIGAYTDRRGNTLQCAFNGPDAVNGRIRNYAAWPLLKSPWSYAPRNGNFMRVMVHGRGEVFDYRDWSLRSR